MQRARGGKGCDSKRRVRLALGLRAARAPVPPPRVAWVLLLPLPVRRLRERAQSQIAHMPGDASGAAPTPWRQQPPPAAAAGEGGGGGAAGEGAAGARGEDGAAAATPLPPPLLLALPGPVYALDHARGELVVGGTPIVCHQEGGQVRVGGGARAGQRTLDEPPTLNPRLPPEGRGHSMRTPPSHPPAPAPTPPSLNPRAAAPGGRCGTARWRLPST